MGFGNGDFDRSAPVEVAADNLEIDENTGQAILTGNVVIEQGDLRLSADRVTVEYTTLDGEREIDRLNANGNVLITSGEDAAEGANAVYILATSEILMDGEVLVTQGPNVLAGDRMSIDLEAGAGTVTGRVRSTLQP